MATYQPGGITSNQAGMFNAVKGTSPIGYNNPVAGANAESQWLVGRDPNKAVTWLNGKGYNFAGDLVATQPAPSGGGGGGGGSTYDAEAAARAAEQARLQAGFDKQKSNIFGTAREAAGIGGNKLGGSIRGFLNDLRTNQQGVDNSYIQSALAKKQGYNSILDMVGRGIKSGGVMLANRNAGDSSGAQAIAEAYGDIGRREMSGVNNEFSQKERENQQAEEALMRQRQAGIADIRDEKSNIINNIAMDARGKLAELDAAMVDADLPTRIAIDQERNKIKAEVTKLLAKYDAQLSQGAAGIKGMTPEQRRAEAYRLANEGVAAEDSFNFSDTVQSNFSGGQAEPNGLPLYTLPRTNEDQLG